MRAKRNAFGITLEDRIFDTFNLLFMLALIVVMLYPFANTIAVSLNESLDTIRGGIGIWPREFTTANFRAVLSRVEIYDAAVISAARTILSTFIGVLSALMVAYPLSRKDFVLKKPVSTMFLFTMYVSGGLIPGYFLMRSLGLLNNFWVYVIPGMTSAFNIMITRSYINQLPDSFVESAKIDGAGEFRILFTIIFPLVLPVLAVVSLFIAVGNWNSWFDTFLFAPGRQELSTLQFELQKVLQAASQQIAAPDFTRAGMQEGTATMVTPTSIRATMTLVVTVPVLFVYPFLQKYFVKGLTLGGVKG